MDPSLAITSAAAPANLDVETTNWNAVKILAVQHYIPISLLEATRDAVSNHPAKYAASHDFGAETPFHITAARLDSGRVVFRFRSRHSALTQTLDFGSPDSRPFATADGMPRSSSSGAVFTQPESHSAEPQKANLGSSLFRKTGNLSLKQSKSIPVLRRKPSSSLNSPFLTGAGPIQSSSANQASPLATSATRLGGATAHAPALPLASSPKTASVQPAPLGLLPALPIGSSGAVFMARAGSTPVSGPHANRYASDYIQEGDVLGAVLGLGQADLWAQSPHDPQAGPSQPQPRRRRSSSNSSGSSFNLSPRPPQRAELRLPDFSFDSSHSRSPRMTRMHQLREAQSFESNASDATERGLDKQGSIDQYPIELHPFLRKRDADHDSNIAKTLVFDVIQCYQRPSPLITERAPTLPHQHQQVASHDLSSASTISLGSAPASGTAQLLDSTTEAQALPTSAAPGDDPRFAIWAVKDEKNDGAFVISNRLGLTDLDQATPSVMSSSETTLPAPTTKRRKSQIPFRNEASSSNRSSGLLGASSPSAENKKELSGAPTPRGKATLLAASTACLVAEITAEYDANLRGDFFYTYREFMKPLDLLELLILRFEWAMSDPTSAEDEARRRIVRVRTYVVIKDWLQLHFEFDFLPNRALRQRLTTWLNTMAKDERILSRSADLSIVNSLRKIVRGLKQTYSHSGVGGLLLNDAGRMNGSPVLRHKTDSLSTFGSSSHDSEPSVARSGGTFSSEEHGMTSSGSASSITDDVDLDFSEDSGDAPHVRSSPSEPLQSPLAGASRGESHDGTRAAQKAAAESVLVSHRHTLVPISHSAPRTTAATTALHPAPMPHPTNAWSRAFTQTVGRLSKFKRVLGTRGLGLDGHNELDSDAEECNDLLFAKGGLDSLLQYFAIDQARRHSMSASRQTRLPRQQRPLSLTEEANEEEEEDLEEERPFSHASEDSTGQEETPSLVGASTNRSTPASSVDLARFPDDNLSRSESDPQGLGIIQHGQDSIGMQGQDSLGLDPTSVRPLGSLVRPKPKDEENLHHAASEQTLRSVSREPEERQHKESALATTSSIMRNTSMRKAQRGSLNRDSVMSVMSNGAPRIVSIDDIDSSDDDDFAVRKALRRLPGARDLRQANTIKGLEPQQVPHGRDSIDSMASSAFRHPAATRHVHIGSFGMGHARGVSVDSALFSSDQFGSTSAYAPAPPMITMVQSEMLDPDEALRGYELVKGFRLDDIESDDDEPGDVEAALRRLEGIIDEDRQKEKTKRVERLWQRSLARNAKNDVADDDDGVLSATKHTSQASSRFRADRTLSSSLTGGSLADAEDDASNASVHPCERSVDEPTVAKPKSPPSRQLHPKASFLDLHDSCSASEAESHNESHQIPAEAPKSEELATKRASSVKSADSTSARALMPNTDPQITASKPFIAAGGNQSSPGILMSPRRGLAPLPPVHRSFLLSYRTESVARQMCLIEAELLRSVTWDELASSRWRERRFGTEVTDWEAFYRDRVRDRLEAQRLGEMHQERAVEAIVARFNLTSNWVASEVVLTQNIDERAAVISKLIRVAWKCYLQSNFASLAQIIFGLSTPWVERLRRTWNRVGYFEMRMWKDLNSFVGPRHNFRHLRNAMLQLVEGAASSGGEVAEAANVATSRGCIPFFGLFLSDLMQYDAMPTFLDPTLPTKAASTTTTPDGKVRLHPADPKAFGHLAPLPATVQLEPLVNLHKFRNIAEVIKQISAFQSAAKNYSAMFEAEKGAYVRCLKLRCLPGELLARLSYMIEP